MSNTISHWKATTHKTAVQSGWWPTTLSEDSAVAQAMMGMHAEVNEAWECWRERDLGMRTALDGKPEGFSVELADVLIRLLNFCEQFDVDIETAMETKNAYNKTRPHRHGGKRAWSQSF